MNINFRGGTAGLDLIKRHLRIDNDICRCQRGQILVLYKRTANAIRTLANAQHRPCVAELRNREDCLICDIGEAKLGVYHRIQDNRIGAVFVRHPLLRKQVRQQISFVCFLQDKFDVITICLILIEQIRCRHEKDRLISLGMANGIRINAVVLLQFQHEVFGFQQILIACPPGRSSGNNNGFFQGIGVQIIAHIDAIEHRGVLRSAAELFGESLLQSFVVLRKDDLRIL